MTAEECKVLSSTDWVSCASLVINAVLGFVGFFFIRQQNVILKEQSSIFEAQNEFNRLLRQEAERLEMQRRLINRVHYAYLPDKDLDFEIESLLSKGIHFSEVAGVARTMELSKIKGEEGFETYQQLELSYKKPRKKPRRDRAVDLTGGSKP